MTLVLVTACATLVLASNESAGEPDADAICAGEVTRKPGWYMYRPAALEACLSEGPLRFGQWRVKTAEDALRLLWGESKDDVRFRLARSLLVARCNQRLFHATPVPADLLLDAERALDGASCAPLPLLTRRMDEWNETGWLQSLPRGFNPPALPWSVITRLVGARDAAPAVCSTENPTPAR